MTVKELSAAASQKSDKIQASKVTILAVDDDMMNLEVLRHILEHEGYEIKTAENGSEALDYLDRHPDLIDIILLDKMMPKMDGIDVLKHIKATPRFAHIPVIMQTASVEAHDVIAGIEAGAYYYLTKPFEDNMLISIVHAAARDHHEQVILQSQMQQTRIALDMIREGHFEVQSLQDARTMATVLAGYFPDPDQVIIGLLELLVNAVEHGNLGIGYALKSELMAKGEKFWQAEVTRRLALPENQHKKVEVSLHNKKDEIVITITDIGQGFDWKRYIDFDPVRLTDPNGRGVAKANIMAFDRMEYNDAGNSVTCYVRQ
jgi:CheY-like chemotaxis protein